MPTAEINRAHLYGLNEQHLAPCSAHPQDTSEQPLYLHPDAAAAFQAMQTQAQAEGIDLRIASGFRSFARQQVIWERKYQAPTRCHMSPQERLADITQWSALPGTSRHHWGTDLDLYDHQRVARSDLVLETWEYARGGPCHALFLWLEQHAPRYGFFRPYDKDRGGVKPEPWHWSFAPVATDYLQQFDVDQLKRVLQQNPLPGLAPTADYFDAYIEAYVRQFVYQIAAPQG
ncbi:hypothetical protein CWE15_03860 [Aliidiomarina taiwanensis]|uniref:D-alanyl-D-alanine carboxypeptidase-like core domain-containing protein n=1 Tax=Aliidiomarina taiwanensis TaxID=946228 RepID=A0A432XAI0_9GAMM|nr:M15 family metallopeptidase [Aliidiomarina taiwanensis]RUO44316.1 hypothetical protein CWE15_03860 [Aliidiomarina taiwanensis]